MNILWHMPTLQRSCCGLSHRAVRLAHELRRAGHQITFTVAADKTDLANERIDKFAVELLPADQDRPLHWALQSQKRFASAKSASQCLSDRHDLFISCQPEMIRAYRKLRGDAPLVYVCGGSTLLHECRERAGQSGLGHVHKSAFALDRLLKRRTEAGAMRAADAIVFDSQATKELVIRSYDLNPKKAHAVIGGVDAAFFVPPDDREAIRISLALKPGQPTIAWTGRFSPEKNLPLLLSAAARSRSRPTLLLVGDGPLREDLRKLSASLGLTARTIWPGNVTDVRPYLHAADIFAFPSFGESFGGSLVEAMACGLPCIALRPDGEMIRTANSEILDHDQTGLLVDAPDENSFANALDELFENPALRQRLGEAARAKAVQKFNWKQAGSDLLEIVETLKSERAGFKPQDSGLLSEGHPCVLAST